MMFHTNTILLRSDETRSGASVIYYAVRIDDM